MIEINRVGKITSGDLIGWYILILVNNEPPRLNPEIDSYFIWESNSYELLETMLLDGSDEELKKIYSQEDIELQETFAIHYEAIESMLKFSETEVDWDFKQS